MPKNNKYAIVIILLLTVSPVFAQINTYSPYSRYGLGELYQPGLTQNSGLGTAGVALQRSTHINYINPASYSAIDTMSFVFDFGLSGYTTNYMQGDEKARLNNFNLHHIAIGFPITRWLKAAAGIVPYSRVGYRIVEEDYLKGFGPVEYHYEGDGGLNKLFVGTSAELFDHVSVGANLSYMFGFLEYKSRTSFPFDPNAATTLYENRLDVNSIIYNFGIQYRETFRNKYFLLLGMNFDNEQNLNVSQQFFQQQSFVGVMNDTAVSPVIKFNQTDTDGKIIYPQNLGAGLSFGINNRLLVTGEYTTQQWSRSKIPGRNDSLVNSSSIRGGIEVTPNPAALRGYFNHVGYRLGGYYTNSYLRIRDEQLKDYGITFGVRLPFRGSKTAINLGVVVGKRSPLNNDLVKENYGIINLGITLQDFWFHKRKID